MDGSQETNFETAYAELQEVLAALEDGSQGLEESLAQFERGIGLLRHCRGLLEKTERRIEILTGYNALGEPVTAPFDGSATIEQSPRAGRRSAARASADGDSAARSASAGEVPPTGSAATLF